MIGKEFKKYEMVIPGYGEYETSVREAGEAILRKGPVLVDDKAVLEFQIARKEIERLKDHLEEMLKTDTAMLAFYVRRTDETDNQ